MIGLTSISEHFCRYCSDLVNNSGAFLATVRSTSTREILEVKIPWSAKVDKADQLDSRKIIFKIAELSKYQLILRFRSFS